MLSTVDSMKWHRHKNGMDHYSAYVMETDTYEFTYIVYLTDDQEHNQGW